LHTNALVGIVQQNWEEALQLLQELPKTAIVLSNFRKFNHLA
jgi:hypothetical protein